RVGAIEGERAACDVGLRVVVPVHFDLAAKNEHVASPEHTHAGGEVPLRVAIDDETLSPTGNGLRHIFYARRRRVPHSIGHSTVKAGGQAIFGKTNSAILGRGIVPEGANPKLKITDVGGGKFHV